MKEISRNLVNKFIIQVVIKALGPEFAASIIKSIKDAYVNDKPSEVELAKGFQEILEYFADDLLLFSTTVLEYLSLVGDDEEMIRRVGEAMDIKNSDLWKKPADKPKDLKEVAQDICEKPKPEPRERKVYTSKAKVNETLDALGPLFANWLGEEIVKELWWAGEAITKEKIETKLEELLDRFYEYPGLLDDYIKEFKAQTMAKVTPEETYHRDAKGRLRDSKGHFVKEPGGVIR